ncbi:ABC transporter ATP-binding protein [Xylanibacillus composti]|uniref:Putative ABC transporter ATP-binding protein YknV n=1 Tax=Xylanibacillus composti TaxID=1572762 RepID=A0A8J4H681_9BACL|nr:ABC transporter ATP-binding protein [Xylanibacillus composti]MDT9725818.1 ABC transporter ATP-binding protein [Xylanibacillus composti]GIQ69228.1 putative ABC transporter ATP-binding protein YknV [Xylanibacillus composti]
MSSSQAHEVYHEGFNPKKERFHYSSDSAMEKPFNWSQLLRLFHYMKPYSLTLLPLAIFAMLVATGVRLVVPLIIAHVLHNVALEGNVSLLWKLVTAIALLYIFQWFGNKYRIAWMNQLGQKVIFDLRQHLFSHIQRLSHRFFGQRSAGSILVRITNDINSLQELFTNGIINLMTDILMLIGIVGILFYLSPTLTVAVMVIVPVMFFFSVKLRRAIRRAFQQVRLKQSRLNSHLNESIQGIRVTQSYTQEQENMGFFQRMNRDNFEGWRVAVSRAAMFRPVVEVTGAIGTAILILFGVFLYNQQAIELYVFVAFVLYLPQFWEPIQRIGQMYNQLLMAMASSERIFEFLDERSNVVEKEDAIELGEIKGHIRFDNVQFSYDEKRIALHRINLEVQPGETIALVGHTGSGKSSIVNLLCRFYDPTQGRILIDGQDLRDLTLDSLRKQVSIVLQDTFIFSGTIMDNIRFGRPDATDEEVIAAAKAVGADKFIERLTDKYETEVEERGNILSMGEKQLLSFARTLLADPRILILDEATASIDTETEIVIQQALKRLLKGRTAIMIAHRLSTIRDADQILVLDHGNIIEKGNHQELMELGGEYFQLVKAQFNILEEESR